jgi:hypothetical protein
MLLFRVVPLTLAQRERHLGLSLAPPEERLLQVIYQYLLLHLKDPAR